MVYKEKSMKEKVGKRKNKCEIRRVLLLKGLENIYGINQFFKSRAYFTCNIQFIALQHTHTHTHSLSLSVSLSLLLYLSSSLSLSPSSLSLVLSHLLSIYIAIYLYLFISNTICVSIYLSIYLFLDHSLISCIYLSLYLALICILTITLISSPKYTVSYIIFIYLSQIVGIFSGHVSISRFTPIKDSYII